jgi:hypothetical protein
VKCIVQTLKCCGCVLEEEERSKPSNNGATPVLGNDDVTEISVGTVPVPVILSVGMPISSFVLPFVP